MSFDPVAAAGLVTREVRSGFRDGAATKITVARRTYPAGQADLWDALTSADRIPRWFLPVSGDLRPGGRYQLEGNAGGVVERCQEPESFAVTWEFGGGLSWLEVTLTPDGEHTTLELAHESPVTPGLWGRYGPGAVGVGWDMALMGLSRHIGTGAPVDPQTAVTFPASPEGAEFIRTAAAGWADAAAADGDEPGAAREAAARTVAFYTGQPEPPSNR
ncbi:MAG TPA: SRPBCC family protein [Trebonia sp.]|nr:SRPBCC family protein [Trebonia sp.]